MQRGFLKCEILNGKDQGKYFLNCPEYIWQPIFLFIFSAVYARYLWRKNRKRRKKRPLNLTHFYKSSDATQLTTEFVDPLFHLSADILGGKKQQIAKFKNVFCCSYKRFIIVAFILGKTKIQFTDLLTLQLFD